VLGIVVLSVQTRGGGILGVIESISGLDASLIGFACLALVIVGMVIGMRAPRRSPSRIGFWIGAVYLAFGIGVGVIAGLF
jgi:hypothetical protein